MKPVDFPPELFVVDFHKIRRGITLQRPEKNTTETVEMLQC